MIEELIDALENRLEHGEDKESLRAEVLDAGHSNDVFEEAFKEANRRYQMGGGGEDSEASFSDTTIEEITNIPQTRARGDLYTLKISTKTKNSGLIGYIVLLKNGWQISKESFGLLGGLLGSFLILGVSVVILALAIGGYVASEFFVENNTTLATLLGLVTLGYLVIITYLSLVGFAFFRGVLFRKDEVQFWSHFRWAGRHFIPILLLSFYIQIITQAGFVLFVIPGFVAMVYLGYAQYVLALQNVRGFEALISSFELVYGRFWAILGRKLFLLVIICLFVFGGAFLFSVFPILGLVTVPFILFSLYLVFCSTIALYESVAVAKPMQIFNNSDRGSLRKWLLIVVLVGTFFWVVSFFSMVRDIDSSHEYPEIENIINSIRKNSGEETGSVVNKKINAAQIKLITSYIDEIPVAADRYEENNGSYAGVCSDEEGVNTLLRYAYDSGANNIFCHDDRAWYVAEAELSDSGTYYCVDSIGNSLIQQFSRNGYETCIEEWVSDISQPKPDF